MFTARRYLRGALRWDRSEFWACLKQVVVFTLYGLVQRLVDSPYDEDRLKAIRRRIAELRASREEQAPTNAIDMMDVVWEVGAAGEISCGTVKHLLPRTHLYGAMPTRARRCSRARAHRAYPYYHSPTSAFAHANTRTPPPPARTHTHTGEMAPTSWCHQLLPLT